MDDALSPRMSDSFTYRDLDAWKQGMALVEECYRLTGSFPTDERYGLTSQLRRAAVSIPSNIAEGHCRRTTGAYANHVSIALGSHGEFETCVELARRPGLLKTTEAAQLTEAAGSVGRLLSGLHRSLAIKIRAEV
jgi:four helix bundle protein